MKQSNTIPEPDEVHAPTPTDRRLMYYISLLGFFAIFSTTISKNPVLPLFMQSIGSSDAVIGLISAISPFAGILFSFPVGVLSDRLGRRRLLITAGAIFLVAPLLYLFIETPLWMIPVRFFHGTATAILGPVISAVIVERFFDKKGEMLGKYASSTLIGRTIAPLAGGMILSFFAAYPGIFQFRMVYVAAALAAVPVFVMTLFYRERNDRPLKVITLSVFRKSFVNFFSHSTVATSAYVADIARKEEVGASMGALSSTMDIGHSAGPLVTGMIITVAGFAAGFYASFVLAVVITGMFVWSAKGGIRVSFIPSWLLSMQN